MDSLIIANTRYLFCALMMPVVLPGKAVWSFHGGDGQYSYSNWSIYDCICRISLFLIKQGLSQPCMRNPEPVDHSTAVVPLVYPTCVSDLKSPHHHRAQLMNIFDRLIKNIFFWNKILGSLPPVSEYEKISSNVHIEV